MATVRKLPSGKFNAQIRTNGHPSKSRTFRTRDEADAWVNAQCPSIGKLVQRKITMADLVLRYCSTQLKGKPSRHMMLEKMERAARSFPQPFCQITRTDVNNFRLMRLEQVSGSTVREDIQMINKLFRWADREMIFGEDALPSPARNISLPPASKPSSYVVEKNDLIALMSALTPTMATIVELAYETAMRRSEILKLRPRNLKLNDRYLSVIDGKTGDREVPLTNRAVELLTESLRHCSSLDDRLYPLAAHSVSTAIRRARRRLGLNENLSCHQLRHTRITMVARKGFNQAQIMMVSGHKDSRSVQRYTHLNVKDVVYLLD